MTAHAISVDVEDYRQNLRARFGCDMGPVSEVFERDMADLLALLDATDTRATFFVIGAVAEQRPDLVRTWMSLGHEIASHGYGHEPIWAMTPEALTRDLLRARGVIEDAIGAPVRGYRAPIFSVRWDTLWALDVIRDCGFVYDSSVVPVRARRYGIAGFAPEPACYVLPSERRIVEVPLATGRVCGLSVPIGGGGYFRLFSLRRTRRAVMAAERADRPFVMYCHPDEFGSERFSSAGTAIRLPDRVMARIIAAKSNIGRRKFSGLVRALLSEFRFGTLGDLADSVISSGTARLLGQAR